jgi:hypothetical protein
VVGVILDTNPQTLTVIGIGSLRTSSNPEEFRKIFHQPSASDEAENIENCQMAENL